MTKVPAKPPTIPDALRELATQHRVSAMQLLDAAQVGEGAYNREYLWAAQAHATVALALVAEAAL